MAVRLAERGEAGISNTLQRPGVGERRFKLRLIDRSNDHDDQNRGEPGNGSDWDDARNGPTERQTDPPEYIPPGPPTSYPDRWD